MSDQANDEHEHYSMILEWEPSDRIYIVSVPELKGGRTHGETREEAVQQGQEAIEGWIDAMRHWERPVSGPRFFDLDSVGAPADDAFGAQ